MHIARSRVRYARFLAGALIVTLAAPAFCQTVLMGVHPLFDGLQPGSGVVPMEVDLRTLVLMHEASSASRLATTR